MIMIKITSILDNFLFSYYHVSILPGSLLDYPVQICTDSEWNDKIKSLYGYYLANICLINGLSEVLKLPTLHNYNLSSFLDVKRQTITVLTSVSQVSPEF